MQRAYAPALRHKAVTLIVVPAIYILMNESVPALFRRRGR